MVTNPVKGPSPSDPIKGGVDETKTSSNPHRKIEKVEKVGEVDPEQQSRARKFRAFVEEDTTQEPLDSKLPSPINLFSEKNQSVNNNVADAVPSPTYSPPPKVSSAPAKPDAPTPPLPRSDDFWSDIDEPIQKTSKHPKLTQKNVAPSSKKKDEFFPSAHLGIPIKEPSLPSPTELVNKEVKKTKKEEMLPEPLLKSKPEGFLPREPVAPMSRPLNKEEKKAIPAMPGKEKQIEPDKLPEKKRLTEKSEPKDKEREAGWNPFSQPEVKGTKDQKKEEEPSVEIKAPSSQPLPIEVIPAATAATLAATSYLHPETMALFYQMVGTIYVMSTPPGITRTEIVLNATSYTQSKFYGASIIIEKYATAPNSFNIRLTGSNEAVAAFNQNIPSLVAAFRKGNFSFGIGRIEAEYKDEKPLFRRKEKSKGTDLDGDFKDKER